MLLAEVTSNTSTAESAIVVHNSRILVIQSILASLGMKIIDDKWNSGDPYEYFMGRWSKLMAPRFLDWLNIPANVSWLDIGCGTGALSKAIYVNSKPSHLSCIDPSPELLVRAKERISGGADFSVGSVSNIPKDSSMYDIVVSALALNFFPDLTTAFSEMKRVLKPNGTIAAYVWDYAGKMEFLRLFWDAACEINPDARNFDEAIRFPICNAATLTETFKNVGLDEIKTAYLDVDTVFKNFEDYWKPFLGGQGPARGYLTSFNKDTREEIKTAVYKKLPVQTDGSIRLIARAIAVRAIYKQ